MPEKPIRQMTDDEVANFACPKCSCTGVMFDGYSLACRCGWRKGGIYATVDLPENPPKKPKSEKQNCPKCGDPTMLVESGKRRKLICVGDEGCNWQSRPDDMPEKPKSTAVPTCPECGNGLITGGPPPNHFYLCMDQGRCRWRSRPVDATANPVEPPEKPADADEPVRLSEVESDVRKAIGYWLAVASCKEHGRILKAEDRAARFFRLAKRQHRALQRAQAIMKAIAEADRLEGIHGNGKAAISLRREAARNARVELGLHLNGSDATPPSEPADGLTRAGRTSWPYNVRPPHGSPQWIAERDAVHFSRCDRCKVGLMRRRPEPWLTDSLVCGKCGLIDLAGNKPTPDLFAPTPG